MNLYGIGIDMSEIKRFEKIINSKHFIHRVFGNAEIEEFKKKNYNIASVCAAFCVKEAFSKAIGTGLKGISLNEICTLHDKNGKPYIELSGKAKELAVSLKLSFEVSITHTRENAAAVVIAVREV